MPGCIVGPMLQLQAAIEATDIFADFSGGSGDVFHFDAIDRPDGAESATLQVTAAQRPFILMVPDYPNGFILNRQATGGYYTTSGTIEVITEKNFADFTFEGTEAGLRLWDEMISSLITQTFEKAWDLNLIDIQRIHSLTLGKSPESDRVGKGEYFGVIFKVDWGVSDVA